MGNAVAGYLGARDASTAVTRAAGGVLVRQIKRDLRRSTDEPAQALARAVEELADEGLRFAGVVSPRGDVLAAAGSALGRLAGPLPGRVPFGPLLEPVGGGARWRVAVPLGRGGRHRLAHHGGPGAPPPRAWRRAALVLEFEPVLARAVTSRALTTLIVSLAAAAILLLLAAVFWRLSARADVIEAQLGEQQRLAALGRMSAVLGHELKNPLAALKGHAQLLLEKLDGDHPGRRGAETVVREANRLEQLTHQVLDYARTGRVERSPTAPLALARSALERATADPVTLTAPDTVPDWPLDGPRLEQVLVNLLDNARQASQEGQAVELSVSTAGDQLLVEVADRGPGIEPGDEERVFEPFHTRRTRGTGLGLALAKRVVEGHGGRITAANRPGGGATFRLEIPRE